MRVLCRARAGVGQGTDDSDVLDVSLHDAEFGEEVALTVHLIAAANQLNRVLSQREIDRILGIA